MQDERQHSENNQWFSLFIEKIANYPEFRFAEGDFLKRLESACYYNLGGFRYPINVLLKNIMQNLGEKLHDIVVVQNLKFLIVNMPVYKVPADGAVMSQDINHVVGPVDEAMDESELQEPIEKIIANLENFKPSNQGDIIVSSPAWCKARYLIEAVIYHFENEPITNYTIVESTLLAALEKANQLEIQKLAIEPFGTEHHALSEKEFTEILYKTLFRLLGTMPHLKQIIIATRDKKQVSMLQKAFIEVFHIKSKEDNAI